MPEWPWTSVRRTVLAFGAGVGNGLALLRISPAQQSHERHGKKRRAPVSRARAERRSRIARESPDFLGAQIMTGIGNGLLEKAQRLEQRAGIGRERKPGAARAA